MNDDLIARLIDLFNAPGPVNWKLAEQVARNLAGAAAPVDPGLSDEYRDLVRLARHHVAAASGIDIDEGAPVIPLDRRGWADANLKAFRYLVEPLAAKIGAVPAAGPLDAFLKPLGPALLGLQAGVMVGFLSHRVLGQFDIGLPTADRDDLYLVVPNIEAFAADFRLDPQQVRMWVALHEVTHQAEFAVPWMRPRFLELITAYMDSLELDPTAMMERIQRLEDPEEMESLLSDPAGLTGLLTGPASREHLDRLQAFMAVIEGYGDFLMDRAAPRLLPDIPRMREALARRRAEPSQGEQILQRLLGLELKRHQYRLGAAFCEQVAQRWGEEALARLWDGPEHLPTLAELDDPLAWAARVLLD